MVSNLSKINFESELKVEELRDLYHKILYPRLIEEKMLLLIRQGKVSKWFSGIGQEGISVGCAAALNADEFIFTMHRNLGVFTTREVPLFNLFAQWQGKAEGFTKGRDRSFHFGSLKHHIVGMISHLGPQLSLAGGVSLAHKLKKEKKVSLAFTGEGATSQGEFHEALNVAAVWKLPVIFVIENNRYGLSTPLNEQYACNDLIDRAKGYGMRGYVLDGNNILEVYNIIKKLAQEIRENPEPILIECKTFRVRGHEEASGTKYVPNDLQKEWSEKDPVVNFENYLLEKNIITSDQVSEIRLDYKNEIERETNRAFALPNIESDEENELKDVYSETSQISNAPDFQNTSEKRFVDAIKDGLDLAMQRFPDLILMGQDIAEYGGVFKVTEGFVEKFGKARVRNTPLCESAIVGIALGLSICNMRAMVEMQFADFVTCGFNQIVNNLAKLNYRWEKNAHVVIRMPTGGGIAAGPFHSQSNEAWFTHVPGLKIVYPSNPFDAKGLLLQSFEDGNPVLFFEHKALYRSITEEIPDNHYTIPFGKARIVESGTQVSIITYGMGVHWAKKAVAALNISADVIDLRTLVPLDYETITESVKKTNRVLILHEDTLFGGIGGEISAWINENLFEHLDAPVLRVASLDMPIPFSPNLEKLFLPIERLNKALQQICAY